MAESKFIKWQDRDNDGLLDICEDELVQVQELCTTCVPNPDASIPNWKNLTIEDPFLNEMNCHYQITVPTPLTTTGAPKGATDSAHAAALQATYELYASDAIDSLLTIYEKENSAETRATMQQGLYSSDFDLAPRPNSRLKLLYSIPADILESLPAGTEEDEEEKTDEKEEPGGGGSVTYEAVDLFGKLMTVRKALWQYNNYLKIYRFVEEGNLFFVDSNRLFELGNYGDTGFGNSILADVLPQLESFLNKKDLKIPGIGWPGFQDAVTKITFVCGAKNKLTKLEVFTQGCKETPRVFEGKRLNALRKKSAFKDPTAMGYLLQLDAMETDLRARAPKNWLEFLIEYTYPVVYSPISSTDALTGEPSDPGGDAGSYGARQEIKSCIKEALAKEGKQLGQDLLDETFGLADAIMYKFHQNLCYKDPAKLEKELEKMGLFGISDPNEPDKPFERNLLAVAQQRAYESLGESANLCTIFSSRDDDAPEGTSEDSLDDMFDKLDRVKACGMQSLMMEAIKCLFKGMTLEQALAKIVKAALQGMSPVDLSSLFIGLPPEKQEQIEQLIKKKLASGDIFGAQSGLQQTSDVIEGTKEAFIKDETKEKEFEEGDTYETPVLTSVSLTAAVDGMKDQSTAAAPPPGVGKLAAGQSQRSTRTLAQAFDLQAQTNGEYSNNQVIEFYIEAMLEVYKDGYLFIIEQLNKLPGAEIVAKVIATLDCPVPPPPGKNDTWTWIKDPNLPACLDIEDIRLPRLENPFGWFPETKDLLKPLKAAAITAVNEAVLRMIQNILLRVCRTISSTACNAVAIAGKAAFTDATFRDLIKETLCGPGGDADQAIIDVLGTLGPGAVALSDQQQALNFSNDLSMSTTRAELANAMLGKPSTAISDVILNLVRYEYPEYQDAFNNRQSINSFFKNIGNLMPLSARQQLSDFVNSIPEDDITPANPCACATPEQFEAFCQRRSEILSGRASSAQISYLCDTEDQLGPLAKAMQQQPLGGAFLPPIMSSPGCDNGLVPFEPKEAIAVATTTLSQHLEQVKIDFAQDMLGNGPFFESDWGLLNMVLSDTMGNPLSTHNRKKRWDIGRKQYVDYYVDSPGWFWNTYDGPDDQKGGFPIKVGGWLQQQMAGSALVFDSNNTVEPDSSFAKSLRSLNIGQGYNPFDLDVNLTLLPEYGYNVNIDVDWKKEQITFTHLARKKYPDATLTYYNNAEGYGDQWANAAPPAGSSWPSADNRWNFAFDLELYMGELVSGSLGIRNIGIDITRIKLTEYKKTLDESAQNNSQYEEPHGSATDPVSTVDANLLTDDTPINKSLAFEFIGVDETLDNISLEEYPSLLTAFETGGDYAPQVALLHEMLEAGGNTQNIANVETWYNDVMATLLNSISQLVASDDNAAWQYGATWDDITTDDLKYVLDEAGSEPTSYYDSDFKEEDGVLGISGYQWQMKYNGRPGPNRVYYLPPPQFGGSYMSPPIYIAPLENKGWLGFLDVMFPELSGCKPSREELVNFKDIQQTMSQRYPSIPEDERLKGDRDCELELPYNRIMERPAVSGMEGLITATLRIFATTHFIKGLGTYATIKPEFPENYSNLVAAYVVEDMEKGLKDAQAPFWEAFTLFKDQEFWYSFLEQCVQTYSRRIDPNTGDIDTPTPQVLAAFRRLNDYQDSYKFPTKQDLRNAPDAEVGWLTTLSSYREEKNFEAIRQTEEDAKIIVTEMVREQLDIVGKSLIDNFDVIGVAPKINNLAFYLLQEFTEGGIDLDIDQPDIKEELPQFITEGSDYTNGGEFVTENDEDYVGYYHAHTDAQNNVIYMEGEQHTSTPHGTLKPKADRVVIPIGDIQDYGYQPTSSKPFIIEKYTSINGVKYSTRDAMNMIKSNNSLANISEIYPGAMELVTNSNGKVVGIKGDLGVRHGLQYSANFNGQKIPIVTTEVNALDTAIDQAEALDGDSKLLLCLLHNLIKEEKFMLVYRYILGLPKMTAMTAIYNDAAFLSAIGEKMVSLSDATSTNPSHHPGSYVDASGENPTLVPGEEGWDPRSLDAGAAFSLEWRKWDKVLLRNSKARIKRIFKTYYYSAHGFDFNFDFNISGTWIKNLKSSLTFPAGVQLLPWWKKRKLRSNPFDADGKMCEKKNL